jgi:hypothetical protein
MRTLKAEGMRRILTPLILAGMRAEVAAFCLWYNVHRPHRALGGATPAEVRDGEASARDGPSWEARPRYPLRDRRATRKRRRAKGALPLVVTHVEGRKHLPIVALRRAA